MTSSEDTKETSECDDTLFKEANQMYRKKDYNGALRNYMTILDRDEFKDSKDPKVIIKTMKNPKFTAILRVIFDIVDNKKISRETYDWIKSKYDTNIYCYIFINSVLERSCVDESELAIKNLMVYEHNPVCQNRIASLYLSRYEDDTDDDSFKIKSTYYYTMSALYGYALSVVSLATIYNNDNEVKKYLETLTIASDYDYISCDWLGAYYFDTDDYKTALEYFMKTIELDLVGNYYYNYDNVADCHERLGDDVEASVWRTKTIAALKANGKEKEALEHEAELNEEEQDEPDMNEEEQDEADMNEEDEVYGLY
jgi:hypothetical protein